MIIYCQKFKSLVLKAYNSGIKINEIINRFEICIKTLYNWRKGKKFKKYKPFNINSKYPDNVREFVEKYTINNNRFNMRKLVRRVNKKFNKKYKTHNIYYLLKIMNITYKKAKKCIIIDKTKHKKNVSDLVRKVNEIGHDNIISIDESHYELNMNKDYGWAYKGSDVVFEQINNKRLKLSLICAISNNKVICSTINKGSVNSDIFHKFIKKVNRRVKNKYLLMDNAKIHKTKKVINEIEKGKNKCLFNVPYNPHTNPIEQVFNKSKILIKTKLCDTGERLIRSIKYTLQNITGNDLNNFYMNLFYK